jgi:hypothetical protein
MPDIVDRLRNRIHDSHMDAERLMDDAEEEIILLRMSMVRIRQLAMDNDGDTEDACAALDAIEAIAAQYGDES